MCVHHRSLSRLCCVPAGINPRSSPEMSRLSAGMTTGHVGSPRASTRQEQVHDPGSRILASATSASSPILGSTVPSDLGAKNIRFPMLLVLFFRPVSPEESVAHDRCQGPPDTPAEWFIPVLYVSMSLLDGFRQNLSNEKEHSNQVGESNPFEPIKTIYPYSK